MISINIYELTRISDASLVQKLDRQMSHRSKPLNVKSWEVAGLAGLSAHLYQIMPEFVSMRFFYSFVIPKIGKEFDLIRISDDTVINIELKSEHVPEETIKRQLLQNKYYLASLGRTVRSYTYISNEDKLYRLTKSENLIEADWSKLCSDLLSQQNLYDGDIEALFNESHFLISPLTDSEKFLNREYFLTFQQRDIRKEILKNMTSGQVMVQGFTGVPGTGKTLLLYDIAMSLSEKLHVCVLHFGFFPEELSHLDERLKRIDFYSCQSITELPALDKYSYILVDEGHQMPDTMFDKVLDYSLSNNKPLLFAFDQEEAVSDDENDSVLAKKLGAMNGCRLYQLTNRIRMNKELSSFIQCIMCSARYNHHRGYPSVEVAYANTEAELEIILDEFIKRGYIYIDDATNTTCKEFDKVLMIVDESYYYDEAGWLRYHEPDDKKFHVRNLFHGLSRAKNRIGIIVYHNPSMIRAILELVQ